MIRRVYCTTFGGWWSFTPERFKKMCEASLVTDPNYELEDFGKRLWTPPYRYVGGCWEPGNDGEDSKKSFWPKDASLRVYNITDWTDDDYRQAMQEVADVTP